MKRNVYKFRGWYVTAVLLTLALGCFGASRGNGKKIEFTTNSKEAKEYVAQIVNRIETFQFGPDVNALAKKSVDADPNFAFGYYLLGTTAATPDDAKKYGEKATELAKTASDGERRYIEAVLLTRAQKTEEALAKFLDLAKEYPDDRMVQMLLGQVYTNLGKIDEANAAFERAIKLDGSTPRVYTFLGNNEVLRGNYAKARELFNLSLAKQVKGSAPFGPNYGLAFAHIYQGDIKSAVKQLEAYAADYQTSTQQQNFPAVFIWNSIARLHLEYGKAEDAMKAYEKGYSTIPGSNLDETQKKIWLGRLHHGKARTLAKMGKRDEAWKEAETIKKMIEDGGKEGEQFWPAYHYLAGYLKLEAGDYAKAVEELKQTDLTDPFHKLLLARAYDKSGDAANAQKLYKEITQFNQLTLERALSYPEAKKKLKA
ncbi:MAG TPA: tetratricopeptide repeat protein [Blastocatellia bacterium]|jgi:Flp pilus assembly protein TadD, contains TPR repeats|nr:tetratricopeptide repeat protein [Blastocatellia bacterium]